MVTNWIPRYVGNFYYHVWWKRFQNYSQQQIVPWNDLSPVVIMGSYQLNIVIIEVTVSYTDTPMMCVGIFILKINK
jgi:hypothetical protein